MSKHKAKTTQLHPKVRQTCFRFANIILLTKFDEAMIWEMAQRATQKQIQNFDTSCGSNGFYPSSIQTYLVGEVEKLLNISKKDKRRINDRLNEMTRPILNFASDLFFNLMVCSDSLKPWFLFYKDLFQNQSPQKIVLTLNRILKGNKTHWNKKLKDIAQQIFEEVSYSLSRRYTEIYKNNDNNILSAGRHWSVFKVTFNL